MEKFGIHLDVPIVDPMDDDQDENRKNTEKRFGDFCNRKGVNEYIAKRLVRQRDYFRPLMLQHGDTDALIVGYSKNYRTVLRPVLEIIEKAKE